MPCFRPLTAYQSRAGGPLSFKETDLLDDWIRLQVPCGQCIGCRLERSRQTAVRCMHESQLHVQNCFITLTYDSALPGQSLFYPDFQNFIKRVRARFARARGVKVYPLSYYVCGEYGETFQRPHFHACMFGIDFDDRAYWSKLPSGSKIYRSALLEDLWTHGFSSIGDLTFESAAYVARYCTKKLTGPRVMKSSMGRIDLETGEILPAVPEFCHWSLKPAIGRRWLERYSTDVYPRGEVVMRGGISGRPPRYYDKWYSTFNPDSFALLQQKREEEMFLRAADNTPARLQVREQVAAARASFLKRL